MTTRADDEQLLAMLDLADHEGLSRSKIAERFGVTKNSIIGKLHRIKNLPRDCECKRRENQDGGMPRRWWANG